MMNRKARVHAAALAVAGVMAGIAGCEVNPPLMFGDSVNIGLQIASDAAGTGNAGSIGYRQRSIAVVPVSVIDEKGGSLPIRGAADHGGKQDALSVFASFEAFVDPTGTNEDVTLGQVFATGTAAQMMARGLRCRMEKDWACPRPTIPPPAVAVAASKPEDKAAPSRSPYQAPLFFGRTDTLGIALGGSSAEAGAQFDLGYSSRNVALIPAYSRDGQGHVTPIGGLQDDNADGSPEITDALSVMGQFKANAKTKKLGLTLNRYFTTGVAAQELAEGLQAALVAEAASAAKADTATTTAPGTLAQASAARAP